MKPKAEPRNHLCRIANAAILMAAAACTGNAGRTSPEPVQAIPLPSAMTVASSASTPDEPPQPVVVAKPPCDRAAEWMARVPGLRAEGKLDRARRALSRAAEVCPEKAAAARAVEREVLAELGIEEGKAPLNLPPKSVKKARELFDQAGSAWLRRDWDAAVRGALAAREAASPFPEALTLAGRAALAKGDRAGAQRMFDRAVVDAIRREGPDPNDMPPPSLELVAPENDFRQITTLPGLHPLLAVVTRNDDFMVVDLENRSMTRIGIGSAPLPMLVGDGARVYVLGRSSLDHGALLVYDRATSQLVRIFHAAKVSPFLGAISADEKRVGFIGLGGGAIKPQLEIQDLQRSRMLGLTQLDNPERITPSPDGMFFAVNNAIRGQIGDEDDWVKLFDAATARPQRKLVPRRAEEVCLRPTAISTDGTIATMVGEHERFFDSRLRLFDARTGKERAECSFPDRAKFDVKKLVPSPDGSVFVALLDERGRARHLRVWESGTCQARPPLADVGRVDDFGFIDDKHVATIGARQIRTLDVNTGQVKGAVDRPVSAANTVTFSRDGKQLAWGLHDGAAFLWNPSAGAAPRRIAAHKEDVTGVAFVLGGKALATAGDNVIHLWDTETGQPIRTLSGHGDDVEDIVASPDGKLLVSASDDKTARIWDVSTGRVVQTLLGQKDPLYSGAFSPDGSLVATGSREGRIVVHSVSTGQIVREMGKGPGYVYGLAFMGKESLWAWTTDRILRRWDVGTGAMLVEQAKGNGDGFANIALFPDGKQIAVTGLAGLDVGLFDTNSAEPVRTLKRSAFAGANVIDVAVSPDGHLLAGASFDGSLYLWRTSGDKPILTVRAAEGHDAAVAFTEDGYVDFTGPEADRLRRLTICTVGRQWFSFEVCEERLHVPGLFAKVWQDDTTFREP